MADKTRIVDEIGEQQLLLPGLVNEALSANDRAKYLMTLLQSAQAHADHPDAPAADLRAERIACGIADDALDAVVEQGAKEAAGVYRLPGLPRLRHSLADNLRAMLHPLQVADADGAAVRSYADRLERLQQTFARADDGRLSKEDIDGITSGQRNGRDTWHVLVMDLHKELNRLQQQLSSDSIDGARVYGLRDDDRPLVAAFMAGVNRTKPLKFEHPGLGATATRVGDRLVIQNDIGTTDAHVLVVHVEGQTVTLTHTDVHIQRLEFFQEQFRRYAVAWDDTRTKRAPEMEDGQYYLCRGTFTGADRAAVEEYLKFLGSRLVFLIDWNRARKRLRKFAPRRVCLDVLARGALHEYGHMGFLKLGGDQLIFDALQAARVPLPMGRQLSDILGDEKTAEFLHFTLKTASEGLRSGRSDFLVRDEVSAELRHYFETAQQGFLELASGHAELIVELAMAARDCLLSLPATTDADERQRLAARAKKWEHQADRLVVAARAARDRWDATAAVPELVSVADDAADDLEEAVFLLTLLPVDGGATEPFRPLHDLAQLLVQGAQEYLKAVETARIVRRSSPREEVQDFLEAVDRTIQVEHQADEAHRAAKANLFTFLGDFKQLRLFMEVAEALESAADTLMRAVMRLRNYVLAEVLTH